jgi:hypothetical protein
MRQRRSALLFLALALVGSLQLAGQTFQIGIIDFYGLRKVSASEAHEALTFKEGDTVAPDDERLAESERRLSALPGVQRARARLVCCAADRAIIFVGVEDKGQGTMRFRAAPRLRGRPSRRSWRWPAGRARTTRRTRSRSSDVLPVSQMTPCGRHGIAANGNP